MTTSRSGFGEPVLIKKYGNRRLYDTRRSCYITLEDVAGIIRRGTEVKVVEASSGRDLTRQVLTQVILEHRDSLDMIPVELLHSIIRVRGTMEQAPFSAFLAAVTRQFIEAGNLWSRQWAGLFKNLEVPGSANGPSSTTPQPPETAPPTSPAEAPPPRSADDLQSLRQRMDLLLKKLGRE